MERFENCHVSNSIIFFKDRFLKKWNLKDKVEADKPLVIFGCYDWHNDYRLAINHKAPVLIVWGGSDSMRCDRYEQFKTLKHVYHASGSEWINEDLQKAGIKFKYVPITVIDNEKLNLKAEPLGNKIYVYTSEMWHKNYGSDTYLQLQKMLPNYEFIIAHGHSYNREQLMEVYKQSFIGLRLVEHDGISETVVELGLLGRRVVNKGCEPNCLKYTDINSIVRLINEEQNRINLTFPEISESMRNHINIGTDWLNLDYWK